jgi:hypothetical protein
MDKEDEVDAFEALRSRVPREPALGDGRRERLWASRADNSLEDGSALAAGFVSILRREPEGDIREALALSWAYFFWRGG